MTPQLQAKDTDRLAKLVAMFDSSFEGERNAAVAAASALLQRHGKRMSDIPTILAPAPRSTFDFDAAMREAAGRAAARRAAEDLAAWQAEQQRAERLRAERLRAARREREAKAAELRRQEDGVRAIARDDGHSRADTLFWTPTQIKTYAHTRLVTAIRNRGVVTPEACPTEPTNEWLMRLRNVAFERMDYAELWLTTTNPLLDMRRPVQVCVDHSTYVDCICAMQSIDWRKRWTFGPRNAA